MIGCEIFGAQQRDMLACELQQIGFFAGLRLIRDDDEGLS
jgi:hypothetical protein